ncbi:MAG: STAS domain-containing protein, partial [Planctomycetota bacterium]
MHDLHLETERDGETGTIRITGEVQTEIAPDVHAAGHGLLGDGARNLVVDLGGVVFMGSASLAVLIRLDA